MPTKLSRFCDGLMEAVWLASLILVPLFFNVYSSRIFEPDKLTLLRSLALISAAAWAVKGIDSLASMDQKQLSIEKIKSFLRYPLVAPVAALALVYLLSTAFSVTPRTSLFGSYQRLQGTYTTLSYLVIFASVAANLRKREQVERLITISVLNSLPIGLYGILQRYQIDPIPWGGDVSVRIASNLGNSIFVAAYLIMVFPITLGRVLQSFHAILSEETRLAAQVARATVYVFTLSVQVIALYMSGSRGPALGWLGGLFVFNLIASVVWRKRWLTYTILGSALVGIVFLSIFNIEGGPLERLRQSPAIGRFGRLLDEQSNSALVRQYIWEGVVDLVSLHEPLRYPDGRVDRFNFLRPLIGYGPESMYVAYNRFYPPDLGQVEKRNASPDRAHNETWDSLVITGSLGFAAYLLLFAAVFYYGMQWLNLVNTAAQQRLLLILVLFGGAVGTVGLTSWRGLEYFGVGLPFGMAGGLVLYLIYFALHQAKKEQDQASPGGGWRELILLTLFSALISHFLEINFGIAIAATRTYFWIYTGLLVAMGLNISTPASLVGSHEAPATPPPIPRNPERFSGKNRRNRSERNGSIELRHLPTHIREALIFSALAGINLATTGYNFISNSSRAVDLGTIIASSMTRLPNKNNMFSYGVLAFVLTTWLAMMILIACEIESTTNPRAWLQAFLIIFLGSALIGGLFWLWQAGSLASLARITPSTIEQLIKQVDAISGFLTNFYLYIFVSLVFLAAALSRGLPARPVFASSVGLISAPILILIIGFLIANTNLRVIHADITYKMAEPFNRDDQWPVATILYQHAIEQAPHEDFYYLFIGRSYLEQAKLVQDQSELEQLIRRAESDLKTAQRINPLNTDHTANLGRLYSWWASQTEDPVLRAHRAQLSSDYYAVALQLSPQNSTLWGEWAVLYLDIIGNPEAAFKLLQHTITVDPNYNWTLSLMGNYYVRESSTIIDTAQKAALLEKAASYFNQAVTVRSSYPDQQVTLNAWLSLAEVNRMLGRNEESIQAYLKVLEIDPVNPIRWKIEAIIAQLYFQEGKKAEAMSYANSALSLAPEDQRQALIDFLAQLQSLP